MKLGCLHNVSELRSIWPSTLQENSSSIQLGKSGMRRDHIVQTKKRRCCLIGGQYVKGHWKA